MRIVHLLRKYNPAEWGGTETAIHRLFTGLRAHGVDSDVYCPWIPPSATADPLAGVGCRVKRFRACVPVWGISPEQKRQMISVGGNLMSFDLIRSLWREKNATVIHSHTLGRLGGIGRTVARQRRLPFVVTIHGGVYDLPPELKKSFDTPDPRGWEWGKLFGLLLQARRVLDDADAIVTCNAREACSRMGCPLRCTSAITAWPPSRLFLPSAAGRCCWPWAGSIRSRTRAGWSANSRPCWNAIPGPCWFWPDPARTGNTARP